MEKMVTLKEGSAWADNQSTLDKIGEENGNLTFEGNPIGGSILIKVKSFVQFHGSNIESGFSTNEIIGYIYDEDSDENPLPENAIVVDVGIVLNDDTEIRRSQMWQDSAFGSSIIEICNTSVYDEMFCYPVFRAVDASNASFNKPLFDTIMNDGYKQLNVYYI